MQIVKLSIQNLMRVSAAEITPEGNLVIVSGRNAQGKTSILNAIAFTLGGTKLVPDKPIKAGERFAEATVDLGEYIVTRRWTQGGSTLKVENKEGTAQFKSPQVMLDKLVGDLSFDPLEFMRLKPREQRDVLLGLVDLGINLDALAKERQGVYDERTTVGRVLNIEKGALAKLEDNLPEGWEEYPKQPISLAELMQEHQAAVTLKYNNDDVRQKLEYKKVELSDVQGKITALEKQVALFKLKELELQHGVAADEEDIAQLQDPDLESIQQRLATAEETNKAIRVIEHYHKEEKAIVDKATEVEALTKQIQAIDNRKDKAIQQVSFPVPDLSVDETGVTYNGLPINQASSAEQLRVSMAIAMALNPKLRVIRITDGSLLDSENMAIIEEMARDKDFQVWIEVVDESGKVGVVIEDGQVVESALKQAA